MKTALATLAVAVIASSKTMQEIQADIDYAEQARAFWDTKIAEFHVKLGMKRRDLMSVSEGLPKGLEFLNGLHTLNLGEVTKAADGMFGGCASGSYNVTLPTLKTLAVNMYCYVHEEPLCGKGALGVFKYFDKINWHTRNLKYFACVTGTNDSNGKSGNYLKLNKPEYPVTCPPKVVWHSVTIDGVQDVFYGYDGNAGIGAYFYRFRVENGKQPCAKLALTKESRIADIKK